jgi:drug/metabolite transporter (DMT)-like permease
MIPADFLVVLFGLAAALAWGAGDFSGGFATKKADVFAVVLITQAAGVVLLPVLAFVFSEDVPALGGLAWGCMAGIFGSSGLIIYYRSLAKEKMGVVAPVSSVVMVTVPVTYAAFTEGMPGLHRIAGFCLALFGVWLVSGTNGKERYLPADAGYPLLAGLCFGLFLISIDNFSDTAIFWPLIIARITAIIILAGFILLARPVKAPDRGILPVIVLAGVLNTLANAFFALASGTGGLDIATITSALAPGVTLLLAWLILKEKLTFRQWSGVAASLAAIMVISV